ncbi:MFS transporter [Candidatus Peregrinibacteria bacterium]|nr:MFS transporter [Candidatus Peregrinibacteria bacterium]
MTPNNLNSNGNGFSFKRLPVSILSKLFNIAPSQWSRVSECWAITFFFKIGSAIGWTVMTAAFVARFGIYFLPLLFILNAVFIMISTMFFERLIMRMKREILMILMILFAAICLFFAAFMYDKSYVAFFTLVIIAESIFLAQFNVFIPILVGDRFTPLESQRTFPFIESADTTGLMIGGAIVGIFASKLPIPAFLYVWIAFLACVIFVFILTNYFRKNLSSLPFAVPTYQPREKNEIKQVLKSIKQIPFLKSLVIIVLFQWIFMNVLEFQYTKAIEQSVTKKQESTIAHVDPKIFRAAVLSSTEGIDNYKAVEEEKRALSTSEQALLAEKLGVFKSIFYAAAFIIQALFASRIITALGVVGSMLLHPIIMLMSLVGMFLKFGFLSSFVSKMNFEVTNVVYKNAYFASHYAFPKFIRDQAAEFLEGIVRPIGTVIGMILILGLQAFFIGRDLSTMIHIVMFLVMAVVLLSTIRLQPKYTAITRSQLFSDLPYPEKINAIEILAQKGHENTPLILVRKLNESNNEAPSVRIKLISALGQFADYNTLPEILEAFSDPDPEVRLEAAHALMNFEDLGEKFYHHAFSRFRVIETLKENFRCEKSASVRSAIIRVFSLLKQPDIIPFLLDILKEENSEIKADCIYTLGLFHDPNAAHYIRPFLSDENHYIKSNAAVALWQFQKYRFQLENIINEMLASNDKDAIKSAIYAIGEINMHKKRVLFDFLHSEDSEIQLEAAFALAKCADRRGFEMLLYRFLSSQEDVFESMRRFLNRLSPKAKKVAKNVMIEATSEYLNLVTHEYNDKKSLKEIDAGVLEKLRRLYKLLDEHEELHAIETVLSAIKT